MVRGRKSENFVNNPTPFQAVFLAHLKNNPRLSMNEWAKRAGRPESTLRRFLTTEGATMDHRNLVAFATAEGINLDYLLTTKGKVLVPLVGKIGAGAEVRLLDGDSTQGYNESVEMPPGVDFSEDLQALEIEGDSMHPLRDRWRVFFSKRHNGVTDSEIGKLCIVQLDDGRRLLKELHRGSEAGRFNLASWNAPLIADAVVVWASVVLAIIPT